MFKKKKRSPKGTGLKQQAETETEDGGQGQVLGVEG